MSAGLLAVLVIGFTAWGTVAQRERQPLGMITSLPIYWSGGDLSDMLDTAQNAPDAVHWVRAETQKRYDIILLDNLAEADGLAPNPRLAKLRYLLLAQPAALPPADLVALDSWVRGGGRLLLFADPLLTEETGFGLGDRRRPQDMATISPLINRLGLTETFDIAQSAQPSAVTFGNIVLPVHKYGLFTARNDVRPCAITSGGVIAQCEVGRGRAIIVLDAHLLAREPQTAAKSRALRALMDAAFAD
ncbi:ABC transporter [Pontixanthobacter sp.]|uniref:ABC transporter n=1 Tax=Pontixanthobacter sp. TaxID=2792078 RepID=UPI003C7B5FEC